MLQLQSKNLILMAVFCLFTIFSITYPTASADRITEMRNTIQGLYNKAFANNEVAGFMGGTLVKINTFPSFRHTPYEEDSELLPILEKMEDKLSELEHVTGIDCPPPALNHCMVLYGSLGSERKIGLLTVGSDEVSFAPIPITINAQYHYATRIPEQGWYVSSLYAGKTYRISTDGSHEEIVDLSFNPEKFYLEVRDGFSNTETVGFAVLIDSETILDNRVETKWFLLNQGGRHSDLKPPSDCLFLGGTADYIGCYSYTDSGEAVVRQYRVKDGTLSLFLALPLGHVTVNNFAYPYKNGLLVQLTRNGYQTIQYIPFDGKKTAYTQAINEALEKIRNNGDLSVRDLSHEDGQLIFERNSATSPYQNVLVSFPSNGDSDIKFPKPKVIEQGVEFFDGSLMTVERFRSKSRHVPYTIISQPTDNDWAKGKAIVEIYGAYGLPLEETYLKEYGKYWVQEGGAYVFAHIRGGGGFGRKWWQAGYGINKVEAIKDLETVLEELQQKGFRDISLKSFSAGGIVAGTVAITRPDLVRNISLTAPCLILWDEDRGACTEVNEFGNPDIPAQMELMKTYSPGHLLLDKKRVVPFLIIQSSHDDIVPPVVTETFLNIRPHLKFARVIEVESDAHGEDYSVEDRASIATRRLLFFHGTGKSRIAKPPAQQ